VEMENTGHPRKTGKQSGANDKKSDKVDNIYGSST